MKNCFKGLLLLSVTALTACGGGGGGGEEVDKITPLIVTAKNTTLNSNTYVYNYSLKSSVKFKSAEIKAVEISGEVQHSKEAKNGINHLEKRTVSGALAIDSTTYKYNDGDSLITVSSNEKKDFSVADSSKITAKSYDFEGTCVGKIFKSLDNNGNIKAKLSSGNTYTINLVPNFASTSILSIANFLDSGKVVKVLNKYLAKWKSSVVPSCSMTLSSDNKTVTSFNFSADITIKDTVDISITYSQNFSKINEDITFDIPKFQNTIIGNDNINPVLDDVKTLYDNSKNNYYTYKLKTTVDHGVSEGNPLGLAVNSTTKGYAERKVENNKVYFHNELEVDSDYKNKDQYPEYVEDYKAIRADVSSDEYETYDMFKGLIIYGKPIGIEDYDNHDVDDYYMLVDKNWFNTDNIKILRKTTKDDITTYKFGITTDCVKNILKHYNKSIRLDKDAEKWIDVYEGFGNFNVKNSEYIIKVENDKINSIDLDLKGFYDMSETDDVKFRLELSINFDYTQKEYSIPKTKDEIKH